MSKTRTPAQIEALKRANEARRAARLAKITEGQTEAQSIADALLAAVNARVSKLEAKGEHIATEWARIKKTVQTEGFNNQVALLNGALDFAPLLAAIPRLKTETTPTGYIQAKTVEKILKVVDAFCVKGSDPLGTFVVQVVYTALHNGGSLSLTGAQASLSRRVSNEGRSESIPHRAGYSPGTASSQASQVRCALAMLGLADIIKGKRDDVLHLKGERMGELRALFAMQGDEEGEGE
jgi:hypothetical protein